MGLEQAQDKACQRLKVDIYFTSDTHSYIYPYDYVTADRKAMGYMTASSCFSKDGIIIDGGDCLQGSPLMRYEMKNAVRPHLAAKAFNAAGLDIYVPGNHDFDFGYDELESFLSSLDAQVVCANLVDELGRMHVEPYVIIHRNRFTLLVTGAVTDYVNVWDGKMLSGVKVADSVQSLKAVLEETRNLEVDARVCVYHGGFGADAGGVYRENRADEICKLGFDVLLTAHQHQLIEPHPVNGTLVMQAGSKASHYAHVRLGKGEPPIAELCAVPKDFVLSSAMEVLASEDRTEARVQDFLRQSVGHVDGILEDRSRIHSFLYGSSLADYINEVQLALTGADISATSLFNTPYSIGPDVAMSDILKSYPFANSLVTLSIKGCELKKAMERTASFLEIEEGRVVESASFSPGKDERYNQDFWRGLSYSFDLRRKVGDRVVRLNYKGHDLLTEADFTLTIVLNSYRASGTGGYEVYNQLPVICNYSIDIQDALIDSFASTQVEVPEPTDYSVLY